MVSDQWSVVSDQKLTHRWCACYRGKVRRRSACGFCRTRRRGRLRSRWRFHVYDYDYDWFFSYHPLYMRFSPKSLISYPHPHHYCIKVRFACPENPPKWGRNGPEMTPNTSITRPNCSPSAPNPFHRTAGFPCLSAQ